MTKKEFEEAIEKVVRRVIKETLEEKVEAMFYKTLVESNFMSNVISTIYENVDKTSATAQPLQESQTENRPFSPQQYQAPPKPKNNGPKPLPPGLEPMGVYFEGTEPLEDEASAKLKANALAEGVDPRLVGEDGVDLSAFGGMFGN